MGEKDLQVSGGVMDVNKIMALAIEKGNVDQLEKMMELQERYEANEAKKAYHVAMTEFKKKPPKIEKDAHVNYGTTDYKHASLANVTEKINEALSSHGLSASWETPEAENKISVTCKITHILGHSESTTLSAGADSSGGKNSIQAVGSTVTYLQRYTLLSLTGLATAEMDDDGVGAEAEFLTEEQIEKVNKLIESSGADLGMFLTFMNAENVGKIFEKDYHKALYGLKAKEMEEEGDKQ